MAFGDAIVETVLGKPTVPEDTNNAPNTVAEGAAVNTTVGITAQSTFANGNAGVDYSLSADSSGGGFKIDQNTGVVTVADPSKIDFESAPGHVYTITVVATKNNNFSSEQTFTISVTDIAPSTPVDSNAGANTVLEGAANGTAVGVTASSTDVNGGAVTYSLTGDTSGGGFTINATTGVITVADGTKIDYETSAGHAYTVTAQASDGTLTSSQAFTINVGDVSMTTPVDSNGGANSVAEGAAAGTTVGITASATDPSGPAPTYSLIGDTSAGGFTINASTGVVTVANPAKIDFESSGAGHSYNITVQASNGVQTTSQVFTVGVTDVAPSTPTDSNGVANNVIEGAANGTVVGVTAASADVNGGAITYSLTGDTSGGGFTINATTGVITVADGTKINYETAPGHAYTVTAQASDGTLSSSQTFTIAVGDAAPSTPTDSNGATNTVAEGAANGSNVGVTAFSTDVNGPGVTYSLVGDTSGGGFTINSTTGVITVADSTKLDYETTPSHAYTVTAQASDGTLSASQSFTIALTDVAPTAPVDTNAATNTVGEGAANGSTVGITASSVDPNGPATTYSLTDNAGGRFAINSSTGVVTVANGAAIDFETAVGHAYSITVQATNGALTTSSAFSIGVTDVGPSTPADTNGAGDTVFEGAANGTAVGITATSTDPGGGPAPTYTLTDSAGGRFAIDTNTGIVTVANGAAIDFETAPGPGHSYGITVQATAGALTNTQNFSIGTANVNEAPAGTDKAVLIAEDTTYTFSVADFGFSDPSDSVSPNSLLAVKMTTVPGAGTGTLKNNGVTVNAGDSVSAADIASGLLVFTPVLDGNGSPLATFTFQVQDNGGTANSGVDLDQSANTFTINVNAGNDAPINSVPGTQGINEEASVTFSTGNGNAITISDVDVGSGNETVTLTVTGGTLTLGSTAGLASFSNNGTSSVTLSGTVANVNAAMNGLTYTGNLNFAGADTLIVSTNDNGNTGNGGPQNDTDHVTINVAGVNDAPVNGIQGTQTVNEDTTLVFSGANAISISDVDAGAGNETVTLSVASGALTLNGTAGLAFTVGDGTADSTMTFSGTVAAINAALNGLGYQGNLNFNGSDALNITTNDNGNTGSGGAQSDADSITINVSAVNDAPVNGVPGTQGVNEDTNLVFSGANAISISDVDVGAGNETVTLSVASGALTLNGTAGLAFSVGDGTADSTMTFSGTVAAINAALNGLGYQGNLNFNGSDTLNITTSDNGNTGSGGVQSDADSVTINVSAVNDAPVNGVPGAQGVNEEATLTFSSGNGNAISISDVDVGAGNETVTLSVASGLLTLNGTAGLAFSVGDGAADSTMTFSGTVAAINTALNGLTYTGNLNFAGADTLNITTNDNGNTGSGGAQSDADGITINVAGVNDAPVNGVPGAQGVNEDTSLVFSGANAITISDVDVGAGNETVTLSVASGALTLSGTAGLAFSVGDGTADSTMTFSGTVAAINAALNGLGYQGNLNFNGSDTLNITTNDNGNTGSGGVQSDADSVTINIAAVNDAPTLTAHDRDPAYVAAVQLFDSTSVSVGPADESTQTIDQLVLTVSNVSNVVGRESLSIDGTTIDLVNGTTPTATTSVNVSVAGSTATVTISSAGLSASAVQTLVNGLTYTNNLFSPGETARDVTLTSIHDTGGTTPGVDTTALNIVSTVNFNVTPTVVAGGTLNYTENDAATVIDATIDITDPDNANMVSAKVAITGGFDNTQDILSFTPSGGIGGSYNALTGELTLTGTATQAAYETVLGTVTYRNTSDNPSTAQRTVSYTVNDGFANSAAGTATINITATNDAPVTTASGGSTAYIENAAAVTVDGSITVVDPDSSIVTAQVRISANFQTGDSLNFVDQNGITGVYTPGTGVLALSGTTSVANYQTALRSITFSSTNNDPGVSKTVEFKVNDAVVDSNLALKTLAITPVNDEPTLTATANGAGAVTFTETSSPDFPGSGPVDLFSSPATSTVEATQTITQVVLTVTNVADTTEFLNIGGTPVELTNHSEAVTVGGAGGTATVSVSAGTATITVTPTTTFSTANVNALVDSLAYNNDDNTPTATSHTISVTSLTDSGANGGANGDDNLGSPSVSTVVTVTPTNDAPVAVNDTFTGLNGAIVNTTLVVDGPTAGTADPDGVQKTITGNILANDSDVDGGPLTVVAGTFVTAEGGSVTLDTDGGFVYTPKPNTTGTPDTTDSFTYTVTDGHVAGQNPTATGTVTINFVPNSTIWYVDSSYAGAHGASDGSSLRPFTDFTALNGAGGAGDVDAAGDTIFVYDGTYTGNLELESGQKLYGERHGLTAPDGGGGAGVTTLLAADAGAGLTQINGTITANSNNDIQAISWGSSAGVSLTGTNVGALHVNDADAASAGSINNTTGGAVSINGSTAGMNVQFTNVSSGAGTSGISLTNALGTFNATGGTLSGHTTSEISISGGTGTISYGGTIGNGSGDSAQVNNRTGGTVTLSGNINDTNDAGGGIGVSGNANTTINFTGSTKTLNTTIGDGVSMTNNTGTSNVNFTNGGLDIDTTNGTGFQASVAGTYSVTGTGNSITTNGNGAALNLSFVTVGGGGITFDSTSSTNSTGVGVAIAGVTGGAIALGSGSIAGSDGDAFRVGDGAGTANAGGTSAITYSGTISKTDGSGQAVDIQDRAAGAGNITLSGSSITHTLAANTGILLDDNAAGTITFSGTSKAITSTTATAVNLTDNAGATIAFTNGGLVISSTNGNGFNATGGGPAATTGGTVTVEGSGNTITSTIGTALNVANTTIGANDLTFQSITAGTGSNSAGNGITLDNTGSSGGLHVTGNGTNVGATGGGVIQHKTGADGSTTAGTGIYLNNTTDVQLNGLQLNDFQNFGIRGLSVNGVSVTNTTISGLSGNNDLFDEAGVAFGTSGGTNGITGTGTFTNLNVRGGFENNLQFFLTSGTSNLTFTNLSSHDTKTDSPSFGADGFLLETQSSANSTVLIQGSNFSNNFTQGVQANALDTSTLNMTVRSSTFSNNNEGIVLANSGSGHLTATVGGTTAPDGNTVTGGIGAGIFVGNAGVLTTSALLVGAIRHNTVTQADGHNNDAILALIAGPATASPATVLDISNNTATTPTNTMGGTGFRGILVDTPDTGTSPTFDVTVNNNVVSTSGLGANGIQLQARRGNGDFHVQGNDGTSTQASVIFVRQTNADGGGNPSTFDLERGVSASNTASTVLLENNPAVTAPEILTSGTITVVNNGAVTTVPLLASAGGVLSALNSGGDYHLTQIELDTVVQAAIARWSAAGLSADQVSLLHNVSISVADMSGAALADSTPGSIKIDSDAGSYGWFVDPTPQSDTEFGHAASATDLTTDPTEAPAGHMDLLTTVMHEMGHQLGLEDTYASGDHGELMFGFLMTGERRLPDSSDVAQASQADIPQISQAPAGTPIVAGNAAGNTIDAGHGGTLLFGGAGADTFVFGPSIRLDGPTPSPITHVADYSAAQGDTFDFSALTSAFHNSSVSDSLVVRAVEDASGKFATLQVDHIDPMGLPSAPNWVSVAQLDGAHAGDAVNILIDNHSVHLAQIHVDLLV